MFPDFRLFHISGTMFNATSFSIKIQPLSRVFSFIDYLFIYLFYFILKFYIIVLVLPNIKIYFEVQILMLCSSQTHQGQHLLLIIIIMLFPLNNQWSTPKSELYEFWQIYTFFCLLFIFKYFIIKMFHILENLYILSTSEYNF